MVKYERNQSTSGSKQGEATSSAATSALSAAGATEAPSLYPPLNIPEPHVSDKKKAVMNSIMQYAKIIDEARARRFGPDTFRPTNRFQPPNFSAKPGKPKKVAKAVAVGAEDEKMKDTESEDEQANKEKKPIEKNEEDEEKEEGVDTEDEEAPKSDSDIDDYTANAGFDDDELNFDDVGGENENDNQVF